MYFTVQLGIKVWTTLFDYNLLEVRNTWSYYIVRSWKQKKISHKPILRFTYLRIYFRSQKMNKLYPKTSKTVRQRVSIHSFFVQLLYVAIYGLLLIFRKKYCALYENVGCWTLVIGQVKNWGTTEKKQIQVAYMPASQYTLRSHLIRLSVTIGYIRTLRCQNFGLLFSVYTNAVQKKW